MKKDSLKPLLKKPSPSVVVPDGKGCTKGDELLRRLRFEFGYDPIKELVNLARSAKTNSTEKIKIASEQLIYYQPKMKAMDFNPNAGEVINVNISFPDEETAPAGLKDLAKETA